MKVRRSIWTRIGWILLAAACFHLAYCFRQAGFAMVGYLFCLLRLGQTGTARQAFYSGLVVGLLSVGPQLFCFWEIFGAGAIVLWTILAVWIGLFVALTRLCFLRLPSIAAALLIPVVWIGLEYFRSELYYLRFSWLNVGYAFSGSWFQSVFSIFGMYGVGWLIAMLAAALATPVAARVRWTISAGVTAAFFCAFVIHGRVSKNDSPPKKLSVCAVQLEFPGNGIVRAALDRLLKKLPTAELFVLSEYTFEGVVPDEVRLWCREHHRYLIVGGKEPTSDNHFYNTAFVVGPDGTIVFRQSKAVPIQFFNDGLPAEKQDLWNSPWGKIGICICYDLSYTRVTDRLIRLGAQALIVPTMDVAEWGKREHGLHALVAPVRAAEYGIPIFRVASSGISQLVNRDGQVISTAPFPGELAMINGKLQLGRSGALPLDRWGAPAASAFTALFVIVFVIRLRRRSTNTASENNARTNAESISAIEQRSHD